MLQDVDAPRTRETVSLASPCRSDSLKDSGEVDKKAVATLPLWNSSSTDCRASCTLAFCRTVALQLYPGCDCSSFVVQYLHNAIALGSLIIMEWTNFRNFSPPSPGLDVPEDIAGGLKHAIELNWSSPIRLCILIADAPCHGTMYHSCRDNYPKGCPNGLDPSKLLYTLQVCTSPLSYAATRCMELHRSA